MNLMLKSKLKPNRSLSQKALREELYQAVVKYPKTGLYEINHSRTERTKMFIDYVHYLYTEISRKHNALMFSKIIKDFETIMASSGDDGLWLCNALTNNLYMPTDINFNKSRYISNLVNTYEQNTTIDKAGSTYSRYVSIKTNKDLMCRKSMIVSDEKIQEIKINLKRKYDDMIVDEKINEIYEQRQKKLDNIEFLGQDQVKRARLNNLHSSLENDKKYQHWAKLQKIWNKYGFDKIQEDVNLRNIDNSKRNRNNGINFERSAEQQIKAVLTEKYSLLEEDIIIISNIEITYPGEYHCAGEIDLLAVNKRTNNVLAIIEVKHNVHDINYAYRQLQKIFKFIEEHKGKSSCILLPPLILNIVNNTTPDTEGLILTMVPGESDNTGTSLQNIRAIADLISNDAIITKMAIEKACEPVNYDYVWDTMMIILNTSDNYDYDSPVNMIERYDNCLIVLNE